MAETKPKLDAETYLQQFPGYEAFDAAGDAESEPFVPYSDANPEMVGPPIVFKHAQKDKDG